VVSNRGSEAPRPYASEGAVIAILADTHLLGAGRLPPACLEIMGAADLIVHAGDFMTEEALEEIEALGPPIVAVHGNVDTEALRRRLPAETTVGVEGATLGVVHDAGPAKGRLERLRRRFPTADAVVFGHSHMPLQEGDEAFQIFNPGSPTQRRRAPRRTMGVARVQDGTIRFQHVALD
jgi:uncharacterized protein